MRNIFSFIYRNHFFLLFILLESFAVYLLVNHNYYHNSVMIKSANSFTGNIMNSVSTVREYFSLYEVNRQLAEENAKLHKLTKNAYIITDSNIYYSSDTLYRSGYSFVNARVISNSTHKRSNYIMLNKGRRQGIEDDMGVIGPLGVVGIVTEVSENFSKVISLLNKDSRISAKLKGSNHRGFVIWEGGDPRNANMIDLPTYVSVKKGDTIVTSGNSLIFPEDIMIGTVSEIGIDPGENYYNIVMKISVDFNSIMHVYVIRNLFRKEQIVLKGGRE